MKRIMVVDDDYGNRYTLKVTLEDMYSDYEVIGVDSGKQCFELLEDNQIPDVILLDVMMPDIDGLEVVDKLKKNPSWKDIPVTIVTAMIDEHTEETGKCLGDDYIKKPYELEDLIRSIDKVLGKRRDD